MCCRIIGADGAGTIAELAPSVTMTSALFRLAAYESLARVFDGDADDVRSADAQATYTRLFVTAQEGVAAPPYASWYLDGRIHGPTCQWVRRAYAAQGLEPADDAGEPPDYISTELEFMYFLARHEHAAAETGDSAALALVRRGEAEFLLHLAQWIPAFVARVRAADPGPVYLAASRQLEDLIREHAAQLSTVRSKATASEKGA
jgi:TorA maturation chaperone TorD